MRWISARGLFKTLTAFTAVIGSLFARGVSFEVASQADIEKRSAVFTDRGDFQAVRHSDILNGIFAGERQFGNFCICNRAVQNIKIADTFVFQI